MDALGDNSKEQEQVETTSAFLRFEGPEVEVVLPSAETFFPRTLDETQFEIFDPEIDDLYGEGSPSLSKVDYVFRYSGKYDRKNQILVYGSGLDPVGDVCQRSNMFPYLAFGLAENADAEAAENYKAPILLISVYLAWSPASKHYIIATDGRGSTLNPELKRLMNLHCGVDLPEYAGEGLEYYFKKVGWLLGDVNWKATGGCRILPLENGKFPICFDAPKPLTDAKTRKPLFSVPKPIKRSKPKDDFFPAYAGVEIDKLARHGALPSSLIRLAERVIDIEAPLSEEWLFERLLEARLLGNKDENDKISARKAFEALVVEPLKLGPARLKNGFFYKKWGKIRFRQIGTPYRKFSYIAIEELADGMLQIVKSHWDFVLKKDLYQKLGDYCGIDGYSPTAIAAFDEALSILRSKRLVKGNSFKIIPA